MKVAVITGADGGLGQAVTGDLSRDFSVVLASRSILPHQGVNRVASQLDVRNPGEVYRFVQGILRLWGRIDVLVNNAGHIGPLSDVDRIPDSTLLNSFETNVFGPFYLMREVIPVMRGQESGGVIINVSSKAALKPVPGLGVYSASKAALRALTAAAAKELGEQHKVLCVTVCPSGMNTRMRSYVYGREDAGRQQSPRNVAKVIGEIARRNQPVKQGQTVLVTKEKTTWLTPEEEESSLGL